MNVEQLDSYQASISSDVVMNYIPKNPQRMEFRNIAATSKSASSAQISIIPPSNTHLVDRKIYIGIDFTVAATNLKGALRSHVLNSGLIQQSNIVINNGGSFTTLSSDICYGLKRFLSTDHEYTELYETPTQMDQHYDLRKLPPYQFYSVITAATVPAADPAQALNVTRAGGTVLGTDSAYGIDNPASPFLEEAYQSTSAYSPHALQGRDVQVSRGLFPYGNTSASRQYTCLEPLFSGVLDDADESTALTNINRIDINLLFNTDSASRYWSNCFAVAPTITINNVYALVRFMTPTIEQIPAILKTPFKQYQVYKQDTSAISSNKCTVNLNNIILGCVPSYFYLFAKHKIGDQAVTDGETFLRMDSLSITVNNNSGLLSGCDKRSLYLLSRQNGLRSINYTQWDKTIGSVLCLSAADLGLRGGENTPLSFSLTASFTDFVADATPLRIGELLLVTVTEGHVSIGVSSCDPQLGWSQQDELNLLADEQNVTETLEPMVESGSGYNSHRTHTGGKINFKKLWRGVKRFFSAIPRVANTVSNVVGSAAAFIPHPAAQMLSRGLMAGNTAIQGIAQGVRNATNPVQQLALPAPPVETVTGSGMRRKGRGLLLG
jgi:hypothetical protein